MKNKLLGFLLIATQLLLSCSQKKTEIKSLSQLEGGKVFAVPTGTVADKFVLQRFPDAKFAYFNSVYDCALAVTQNKADAAVYDLPVLKNIAGKNEGMLVLDEVLVPDNYGFAVAMENTKLKVAIDQTLHQLKQDGTYEDMMRRWFPNYGLPAPMPKVEDLGTNGVLLFGTAAVTEPMSFVDQNQEIVGFDVEFARFVAATLNKKLEVVNMDFGAMLPALMSGKVDFVGAGMSITEERAKHVLFSESYYKSGLAALVKSSNQIPIKKEEKTETTAKHYNGVGVLMGSIHETYALKQYPKSEIQSYNTVADMLMALDGEKIEGAFMDHTSVKEILNTNPNFEVEEANLFTVDIAAGFPKTTPELRTSFNTFLDEIRENGIYQEMVKRWHDELNSEMPSLVFPSTNEVIQFGVVSDIGLPFATKNSNNWKGFDIELASRFAIWMGKKPVWVDMPFGSLLPAMVSGKIDIITASMMITEERSKQIDFSNPYYASGVSIIGKNVHSNETTKKKADGFISKGTKVGVLMGSIHETYVLKHYPEAEVSMYNSVPDMLMALESKKTDVCFMGQSGVPEALAAQPNFTVLVENLYLVDVGAGFHKQSDQLREDFNRFLAAIRSDGTLDKMANRWLKSQNKEIPEIKGTAEAGVIRVGISSENGLPFAGRVGDKIVGFDIELSQRFGAWSHKKVEWVDMPFGSLLPSLNGGKIDFITATLAITEERTKEIDFSDPYYSSGVTIIGRKGAETASQTGKMTVLDDISDKRVGIFTGTVHDAYMAATYPKAQVFRYESSADMMMSLKSGKIDVAMFDRITAGLVLKRNPDLGLLTDEVLDMSLGVGFNKKNTDLLYEFNSFLKEIRADGTYDQMHKRWFVEDAETAVMPTFESRPTGKKLVVGVSVEDLPYVAIMNGEYVGFDIELMQTFTSRRGYQLELVTIEFPALVAALSSGKVDMITDGIAISEERAKQINFSDEYAVFRTSVIAPKKNLAAYKSNENIEVKKSFFTRLSESFYNNIIHEKRYMMIISGLLVTIVISIFAAIVGTLLGGLVCMMRMSKNKLLYHIASLYISLIRGTPVLVLLMIIYYVVFASVNLNPVIVAVLAFGINFAAYVSEMFRTGIESVDKGQKEAGIASGFTSIQTFIYIIMPQALRQVLPVYKGEFVSLVKMTSIVGYIAVEDLTKASDIIRSRTFDAFFPLIMAAVIYIFIAWLLTLVLDYVEINVDPKKRRSQQRKESKL